MELEKVSPSLIGVVDEEELKIDYKKLKDRLAKKTKKKEVKRTKTKARKAYKKLLRIEKHGGYVRIARDVGLSVAQVREIHRDMQRAFSAIEAEVNAIPQ